MTNQATLQKLNRRLKMPAPSCESCPGARESTDDIITQVSTKTSIPVVIRRVNIQPDFNQTKPVKKLSAHAFRFLRVSLNLTFNPFSNLQVNTFKGLDTDPPTVCVCESEEV